MAISSLLKGDHRALAKAITLIENNDPRAAKVIRNVFPYTGRAFVIGVTGPPGAGKSTLVDKLIAHYRHKSKSVGVLAIDPSSAFTGGALLGDRVRMQSHNLDPNVFIRSMASRGGVGGLAKATRNAIRLLDASGKDVVIVETVGAGQSEVEIVKVSDATVVVTVPQLGDEVQIFKAGLMEIGDIFVVNKADLLGADRMVTYLMSGIISKEGWKPPIVKTNAKTGEGVEELAMALEKRKTFISGGKQAEKRQTERISAELAVLVTERMSETFSKALVNDDELERIAKLVVGKRMDPETAAKKLFTKLWKKMVA
ncbi:MAG: methylmalonyl Co-A mutase-associated GTPase MeaB [Thaumarchaeota archaeon]|nr:methylmalonyl Co-A mutase-associated GTPase MeaB [Nitrososphaerota archaeon]